MKMKRSIALLIALAMSINMFGVTAFAQDTPAETDATGAQITGQSDGQPGEETTPASTPADETGGETTPAGTPADEGGEGTTPASTPADETGGETTPAGTPADEGDEGTTPAGTPAGEGGEGTTPASTPADETGGETTPAGTPADEGDEGTTPASTPADEDGEGTTPQTEADGNPAPAPLSEAQQAFVDAVNALDKEALLALAEAYMANPNAETGDTMDEAYLGITDAEALFAALTADEQGEETVAAANTALQEIKTEVDAALAAEPMLLSTVPSVKYLDASGVEQTAASCTVMAYGSTTWSAGWYVVNSDVTIKSRVTVNGAANLILADGCTLTAKGITVNGTASLTIYGQSGGTGKLTSVPNSDFCAGIGGYGTNNVGDITINGGVIEATGFTGCAGIGGSISKGDRGSVGTITINGGTVTATGSTSGAGIGSAEAQDGGTIIINGGTVTASGATNADSCGAGIGTGAYAKSAGTITINGGTVTATGGSGIINGAMGGAGIGAGAYANSAGTITINGGTVTATGGSGTKNGAMGGAGIGTGANANSAGTITINGGTVTATSNLDAAAIGAGQASKDGSYNITIRGGTVTANKAGGTGDGTIGKVDTGSATVTFTTTDTGNALINAGAITDKSNQSTWHGIIYNTATTGEVYGNQTVANVTLPAKTLTIPTGTTLTVDTVTLPTGGTITNEGTISLSDSGKLTNSGTIQYLVKATGDDPVSEIKTSSDGSTYNAYTADPKTYGTSGTPLYIQATLSSGYTLNQWTVTGTGLSTTSTDNPYVIATTNLNPVTLAATSKVSAYKITYKDQDNRDFTGTNGAALPTTYTPGTETTLADATKTGYTFGGWYTASDCNGTALTTLAANGYHADITLYAKWTKTAAATPTLTGDNPADQTYGSISGAMTVGISDKDVASYTYTYQWYTGTDPSPNTLISGAASASYAIPTDLTAATNPYKYTVKVTATRNDNAEAATAEKTFSVTVNKATVAVPTISDKTYNGQGQNSGLTDTVDYTVKTDYKYISAGEHSVGLSLRDSTNKKWATSEKTAITVNYNITPKPLTPSLTGTTTKVYDGTTTVTGSGLSIALAGLVDGDRLTATAGSYAYADANVGTGKTITASGITLSGTSAGNYTLSATSVTGTVGSITRKPITVTADDKSKTYGEADPAWTYTVSTSTPLVGEDTLTGALTRVTGDIVKTGGYAITQGTLTNGNNSNYDITFTNGTLTINKRTAAISWGTTTTFTYNGHFQAPTATVTNLLQGDSCTVGVDGAETTVGSGTAKIVSLGNNNYALPANLSTQTFSITKAPLTVTAKPKTVTYGDAPANDGVTYTGFADEEGARSLEGDLGYDYSYTQYGNVGTYEITPKGLTSDNYDITFKKGALTVGKRPITVTAADKTSVYGAAVAPLTATVTKGSVVNDDAPYTLSTTATDTANVDSYPITVTANNDNYQVTRVSGTYTINPAKVTALDLSNLVTAPAKNGTPVTTMNAQTQYTGTVSWNGNPAKFLGGTAYTATVTLTSTANYTFTGVAKDAFNHTGATSVKNDADSGTVTIAFPATAAHALSGIALNTAPTKTTYTYGEAFAPTGLVLDLTYDDGTTGTVTYSDTNKNDFAFTPAALTVATTSVGVTYGGKNVDITGITVNKATVAAPAIPAKTYNGSNQTATVAASDDYSVTTNAGGTDVGGYKVVLTLKDPANKKWADSVDVAKTLTFTITPAPLTWDVSDLTAKKPYDGTPAATVTGTLKLSGVVAGDDVGLSYKELTDNTPLTGSYADKEIGTGKTVTVTVTDTALTGAKCGNYTLPNGDIKITNGQIAAPLPIQPAQPQAPGEQLKLTVEDGIPMVPAALQSKPTLNTPAKIESALKAEAAEALPAVPAANVLTKDIELWYSKDNGNTWTEATADKFPTAGVTVVVPYTELSLSYTAAQGMEFTVLHMISAGADAGRIEYPAYTLTQDGVRFTVHSLSPITIAYKPKAATPADNANDNGGETTAATPAPAADAAPGKFTVNAWVNTLAGGTASPMGNTTYTQGKNVTYTITPAAGYRIAKVTVDGVNVGAVSSYTFNYLNRNHEIGAYFEKTTGKAGNTGAATGGIVPQTADGAPLVLWFALLALAAIGLCALVPRRRKKQ